MFMRIRMKRKTMRKKPEKEKTNANLKMLICNLRLTFVGYSLDFPSKLGQLR